MSEHRVVLQDAGRDRSRGGGHAHARPLRHPDRHRARQDPHDARCASGHMGITSSPMYVLPTLSALEMTLRDLGYRSEAGRGRGRRPGRLLGRRPRDRRPGRLPLGLRGQRGARAGQEPGRGARLHRARRRPGAGADPPHRRRPGRHQHPRARPLQRRRVRRLPRAQDRLGVGHRHRQHRPQRGRHARRHRLQHAGHQRLRGRRARAHPHAGGGAQDHRRSTRRCAQGKWPREMLTQLLGKTLGVFGMGTIGGRVATLGARHRHERARLERARRRGAHPRDRARRRPPRTRSSDRRTW